MPKARYKRIEEVLSDAKISGVTRIQFLKFVASEFRDATHPTGGIVRLSSAIVSSEDLLFHPDQGIVFCQIVRDSISVNFPATENGGSPIPDHVILRSLTYARKMGFLSKKKV